MVLESAPAPSPAETPLALAPPRRPQRPPARGRAPVEAEGAGTSSLRGVGQGWASGPEEGPCPEPPRPALCRDCIPALWRPRQNSDRPFPTGASFPWAPRVKWSSRKSRKCRGCRTPGSSRCVKTLGRYSTKCPYGSDESSSKSPNSHGSPNRSQGRGRRRRLRSRRCPTRCPNRLG